VRDNLSANYKLGQNLDLTSYLASGGAGYAKWGAAGWQPIGSYFSPVLSSEFAGSLDGYVYKISGLWINRSSNDYIGLFGSVRGGNIQKLGVEIADVNGGIKGRGSLGGIVGSCTSGNITDCYTTGTVTGTGSCVGGVVGSMSGNITNCYATGAINGYSWVGGVTGWLTGGSMTNCVALNPSISGSSSGFVYRVGWCSDGGVPVNNWARSNMTIIENGVPITYRLDGADCAAIPVASWWTTPAPNGPGWSSTVWIFTTGQLPKLR